MFSLVGKIAEYTKVMEETSKDLKDGRNYVAKEALKN